MGKLRGFVLAGAAMTFIMPFLAGAGTVRAADIVAPEATSYTYFGVEGGYVNLDGADVQAFLYRTDLEQEDPFRERSLNLSDGYYGRVEVGHAWDDTGILTGIGAYVQGWDADREDISKTLSGAELHSLYNGSQQSAGNGCTSDGQPCTHGHADLDRSLIEVGLRFFHDFDNSPDRDGLALGIEPFVAFIDEDTGSFIGNANPDFFPNGARTSELDATAYGALLALDGRHHILDRTVLTGRLAAGAYFMDADTDTLFFFDGDKTNGADASISSNFWGFRGQLAVGLEEMLTDTLSIGVIGRLDYWSDYPSMEWTNAGLTNEEPKDNSIANDDFLALSIGARISVIFR